VRYKDAAEGTRGISVIFLTNQGKRLLDPEVFRETARRKVLEAKLMHDGGGA